MLKRNLKFHQTEKIKSIYHRTLTSSVTVYVHPIYLLHHYAFQKKNQQNRWLKKMGSTET